MSDIQPQSFIIAAGDGHPVVADGYWPAGTGVDGSVDRAVILCHGFKGHRRWGFIPYLATRLQESGIAAVSIDFSHNGHVASGVTDPNIAHTEFVTPDLFRANTLRRERDDLAAVLSWLRDPDPAHPTLGRDAPVGLWGHSRGGISVIHAAMEDPRARAISTWSTGTQPDTYSDRQKASWREAGALEFTDQATGAPLAIGLAYLDEIERDASQYDMVRLAAELRAAHLIIHGERDLAVPIDHGQRLYDTPGFHADKRLLRMLTGHTFGYEAGAPVNDVLAQSASATTDWFREYLK